MTRARRIGILVVRAYQVALSPFVGGACRFDPSCSEYAIAAIESHGLRRGSWLAIRRVARCHPLSRPGIDPVPPASGA
jgi:putative membrane protein insertion efficiency factor